jgi:PPM family protein phosphatase
MALRLVAASRTDVGRQREQNEDACYSEIVEHDDQAFGLFIVADGMGGYKAGEIASQIAIETISGDLRPLLGPVTGQKTVPLAKGGRGRGKTKRRSRDKDQPKDDQPADQPADQPPEQPEAAAAREATPTRELSESVALEHYTDLLKAAITHSSRAIVEYGGAHKEAHGLGSTVTVALVLGEQIFIANVGDSRTYLYRDGKLQRITQDHSLVERLVQAGQIDREDVYDHPHRNLIYRSLGAGRSEVEVDVFVERMRADDALILCSDGLWEMVRDDQLERIVAEVREPAEACDVLIERANENGGEDNITVVLVRGTEG